MALWSRESIINAVNSGMIVTVPVEYVTIGEWSGTGYIVMNPETGVGEYKISGGLNGGSVKVTVYLAYLVGIIADSVMMAMMIAGIVAMLSYVWVPGMELILAGTVIMLINLFEQYIEYINECARYLETGYEELGNRIQEESISAVINLVFSIAVSFLMVRITDWYVGRGSWEVGNETGAGETSGSETGGEIAGSEPSGEISGSISEGGLNAEFQSPKIFTDSKGNLTNGKYTIDAEGMKPHIDGTVEKSQFLYDVDANKAVLDAAAYADEYNLWRVNTGNVNDFANKAKVYVENGPVGITGDGKLTSYINVYRTKTGYVHGCPGN